MSKISIQKAKKIAANRARKAAKRKSRVQKRANNVQNRESKIMHNYEVMPLQSFKRDIKPPRERVQKYISALMNNTAHLLETAPPENLALEPKQISLAKFLRVNDASCSKSFNRTFYSDLFVQEVARQNDVTEEEAMNLKLIVRPLMTHSYRQMSQCEMHYRCQIQYSIDRSAIFDMTVQDYEKTCSNLPPQHLVEAA